MKESPKQTAAAPELLQTRIQIAGFLIAVAFLLLAARFYYIQIVQHDHYLLEAKKKYTTVKRIQGQRGEIFDRDGNLLVGNSPRRDLICAPANLKTNAMRCRAAVLLHKHFPEKTVGWYYEKLAPEQLRKNPKTGIVKNRPNFYFQVKRLITLEKAALIQNDLRQDSKRYKRNSLARGIFTFRPNSIRVYPKGRLLANVLGYVDVHPDKEIPQSGMEKTLNAEMKAEQVTNIYEKTLSGMPLPYGLQDIHEVRDGKSIRLTISEPIQSILEEELDAAWKEWTPQTLYAAIADPHTGEILAVAQRPTFNPDDRKSFKSMAVRVRIAEDMYEPGSVAKPFTVLKGLEEGVVTPNTVINGEKGRWIYNGKLLTDSHAHEKMTVSEVIQKSSNIGTAKIAVMLGPERVYQGLHRFGFGKRTGVPFANEARGVLPDPQKWHSIDITRIPIGYTFQVTLPQLLQAYCGLANNGHLPKLRLIAGMVNQQTKEFIPSPVEPPRPTGADPEQLYKLIRMMEMVTVKGGTARRAGIKGFKVAGKTGTSRKVETIINPKTGRKHSVYVRKFYSSFAGFVPSEDPKLVMVVTADDPKGTYVDGGMVAAPIFRKTMTRVLRYLNIPPTETEAEKK